MQPRHAHIHNIRRVTADLSTAHEPNEPPSVSQVDIDATDQGVDGVLMMEGMHLVIISEGERCQRPWFDQTRLAKSRSSLSTKSR